MNPFNGFFGANFDILKPRWLPIAALSIASTGAAPVRRVRDPAMMSDRGAIARISCAQPIKAFIAKSADRGERAINSQTFIRSDFMRRRTSQLSPTARVFNQAITAIPEALSTTASCSTSRIGLNATTAVVSL
jgi:hypothetical protein